jgi:adenylate kinase
MARLFPDQLVVLGPPGAGKGTQARRLAECLCLVHIGPGEILRREISADSANGERIRSTMAAGELVPNELIDAAVRERLEALSGEQGFVLDGYPRTAVQAQRLRDVLARLRRLKRRPVVVWLDVPRDELVRRLRRRRELKGRADDAERAIVRRLAIYDANAGAVRDAVGSWADVVVIDAGPAADVVTEEILDSLYLIQSDGSGHAMRSVHRTPVRHASS